MMKSIRTQDEWQIHLYDSVTPFSMVSAFDFPRGHLFFSRVSRGRIMTLGITKKLNWRKEIYKISS